MITQEYLVSDLELRLTKSKPSSDLDLTYAQMAYWVDQARDTVTKNMIDQEKKIDPSVILEIKDIVPYEVSGNYFIDTDLILLDLAKQKPIVYVVDEEGNYLYAQNLQNKRYIKRLSFAKPSECNVVYTLSGTSIQLEGSEAILNNKYSIGIVHAEISRSKTPEERYYALPSSIEMILEMAEEIGLRELTGNGFYDITQDGIANN